MVSYAEKQILEARELRFKSQEARKGLAIVVARLKAIRVAMHESLGTIQATLEVDEAEASSKDDATTS